MSGMMLRGVIPWLNRQFDVDLDVEESVAAELDNRKRNLFMHQHRPKIMVRQLQELSAVRVRNCADNGRVTPLGYCFLYDGGFLCTSRTGLSSKSAENVNCIQDALAGKRTDTSTGNGYVGVEENLEAHWPEVVFLENIVKLWQLVKGCTKSDGQAIVDSLRAKGCVAFAACRDHRRFGAWSVRDRSYHIGSPSFT